MTGAQPLSLDDQAMLDVARSYGFGSPESRAIVTAVEHARALRNALTGKGGGK